MGSGGVQSADLVGTLQPVVAVRFCPVLFALEEQAEEELATGGRGAPAIDLPYRMVFALATRDSVLLYDTQVPPPLLLPPLSSCLITTDQDIVLDSPCHQQLSKWPPGRAECSGGRPSKAVSKNEATCPTHCNSRGNILMSLLISFWMTLK